MTEGEKDGVEGMDDQRWRGSEESDGLGSLLRDVPWIAMFLVQL